MPLLASTRWQGTMIGIGLRPLAWPTARGPVRPAHPAGQLAVADRLAVGNAGQLGPDLRAGSRCRRAPWVRRIPCARPAKYSSSCVAVSFNTGGMSPASRRTCRRPAAGGNQMPMRTSPSYSRTRRPMGESRGSVVVCHAARPFRRRVQSRGVEAVGMPTDGPWRSCATAARFRRGR